MCEYSQLINRGGGFRNSMSEGSLRRVGVNEAEENRECAQNHVSSRIIN